jgi:oligopeptide/dipeptide ABC transporter ATP-binding protein
LRNLSVEFTSESGTVRAVTDVSWEIYPGEVLGIVGESGSGKSVSVSTVLGLLASPPARVTGGPITFMGNDLLALSSRDLRRVRGNEIAMIFQNPMTAFNPVLTIGSQVAEAIRVHDRSVSRRAARRRSIDLLGMVGVPAPAMRFQQFPFEYSGGMLQRAMIAMAIANQPRLIIADEPTTALDVTIQAQIMELLRVIQEETQAATILITHDLGLIAEAADRVLVMYAGRVVEQAGVVELFQGPKHPYTIGLLGSLPSVDARVDQLRSIPGQPPSLNRLIVGCPFQPRCGHSKGREICCTTNPSLVSVGREHSAACHFSDELPNDGFDDMPSEASIDIDLEVADGWA